MAGEGLTPQRKRFCEEYVKDLRGKDAAIRAGYSAKSAETKSSKLLAEKPVKKYIAHLQQQIAKRNDLTVDAVIQELALLGFYNIQDLLTGDNTIERLKSLTPEVAKCIVGVKVTERKTKDGDIIIETDLKLADKKEALKLIGMHLGAFAKDNEQKRPPATNVTLNID